MLILYLHGFASSVQSTKASFFASQLGALGLDVQTPDLNAPDFTTLTVSRMIDQVTAVVDVRSSEPVTLIGSSLGGFVAIQVALARPERIRRLILLAPALDLSSGPPGDRTLAEWKRTNRLEVYHYAYGRVLPIHYGLFEDAQQYDCLNAELRLPVQVFQGREDTAVDPEMVRRWAEARPNVELHLLDDGHQLSASLPYIWEKVKTTLVTDGQA